MLLESSLLKVTKGLNGCFHLLDLSHKTGEVLKCVFSRGHNAYLLSAGRAEPIMIAINKQVFHQESFMIAALRVPRREMNSVKFYW